MAIKVKAVESLVKFSKTDPGVWRWLMRPELYTALDQKKVIKEAALRSGVSQGVMQACWDAAGEVIKAWATEGHSVALPGLGSMRFGLNAKAVEDVNKVSSGLISSRKIIFVPNVELKDELKNTSINITCYDRNGNVVKSVKSSDDGTVEDPENENANQNENQNQDAAIHYTTDGSTPTAESAVYSEAFSLSATTTVKAIAIKDGVSSEVVSKVFTKSSGGLGQN